MTSPSRSLAASSACHCATVAGSRDLPVSATIRLRPLVIAWLTGQMPAETGAAVIHNDYKFDNLVLDPQDASDHAVRLFNERLFHSPHFYATQLPIRDGVSIGSGSH